MFVMVMPPVPEQFGAKKHKVKTTKVHVRTCALVRGREISFRLCPYMRTEPICEYLLLTDRRHVTNPLPNYYECMKLKTKAF